MRAVGSTIWSNRKTLWNVFKYVLAISLLTYVVWQNWGSVENKEGLTYVWQQHFDEGKPIHYHFLVLAALINLVSVLLTFVRWYVLVRGQGLPFR